MLNRRNTKSHSLVQSVARALHILQVLGQYENGLGVTELAGRVNLKVPTTHNLLRTLLLRGYVARDGSSQRYRLGFNCARLGRAYLRSLRIPEVARPIIEGLALRLNESVIVATSEQGEIVFVARAAGNRMLAVNFERSWVKIGYTSVCGRVLLAHLPERALESYIESHPIEKGQIEDIRNRGDLDRILAQARGDGHLQFWRENNTVLAVAAPIRDYTGDVVASVGLGMPAVRFRKSDRETIVAAVKEAARNISVKLGCVEPEVSLERNISPQRTRRTAGSRGTAERHGQA